MQNQWASAQKPAWSVLEPILLHHAGLLWWECFSRKTETPVQRCLNAQDLMSGSKDSLLRCAAFEVGFLLWLNKLQRVERLPWPFLGQLFSCSYKHLCVKWESSRWGGQAFPECHNEWQTSPGSHWTELFTHPNLESKPLWDRKWYRCECNRLRRLVCLWQHA